MISVEITVCHTTFLKKGGSTFVIIFPISKPYITNAILLPTSTVAMSFDGFRVILVKMLAIKPPCFFWISICTLLEDTYAISNPEKKADKMRVMIIIAIENVSIVANGTIGF